MNEITTSSTTEITTQTNAITNQIFSYWLETMDAKGKTLETYSRNIRPFAAYLAAHEIRRPVRKDIVSYRDALDASGHKATTTAAYLYAVKAFFRWTEEEGIYPNIAKTVKRMKIDKEHKRDYLGADQVRAILAKIDRTTPRGLRDYAIISLMVTTGLRTVEVMEASIEDLRQRAGGTVLYIRGKGHDEKSQFVKIEAPVFAAISDYLETRSPLPASGPLFASEAHRNGGERMTTKSISRICKEAMIAAGYKSDRLTAHSLRHTAATLSLKGGSTLQETQQLLRHESITTTMIYVHALERENNRSEARIAAAVFG